MRNKTIIILILAWAVSIQASGFKKYAGEFLSAGVGSRALGMAGAYVAVANDVTAGYWNPAGLMDSRGLQFQFMHAKQFMSSIQYDYFGGDLGLIVAAKLAYDADEPDDGQAVKYYIQRMGSGLDAQPRDFADDGNDEGVEGPFVQGQALLPFTRPEKLGDAQIQDAVIIDNTINEDCPEGDEDTDNEGIQTQVMEPA